MPFDVKYNLVDIEGNESKHPFEKETFDGLLTTAISMRANMHQTADKNICSAQEKQGRNYNRRHQVPEKIKVGSGHCLLIFVAMEGSRFEIV